MTSGNVSPEAEVEALRHELDGCVAEIARLRRKRTRPTVATAIRFQPAVHEALIETAAELGTPVNWLVNKLCEEGLNRIDLNFQLTRSEP